jgi:4-carboxymuconolactone decarboxylase
MSRLPDLQVENLTAEQKRIYDEIAGVRHGVVRGPFPIWLRVPAIADRANQLGNVLRANGKLDKRLFELMVLIIARRWSAQYEWYAHARAALEAGLSPQTISAIQNRRPPESLRDDEKVIYEVITELADTGTLAQPTYDRGVAALGVDLFIELITAAGFYTMIALVLNVFDAPVPTGEQPLR